MNLLQRLKEVGTVFAAWDEKTAIDVGALWKAFVYIAEKENPDALESLKRAWPGFTPQAPDLPGEVHKTDVRASFTWDPTLRNFFGPLGILGRRLAGAGDCTPSVFLSALREWCLSNRNHAAALPRDFIEQPAVEIAGSVATPDSGQASDHDQPEKPGKGGGNTGKSSLGGLAKLLDELKQDLRGALVGQVAGIDALVDSVGQALARPADAMRPRGMTLLFGPRGCGKRTAVDVLRAWVARHRDQLPVKRSVIVDRPVKEDWEAAYGASAAGNAGLLVVSGVESQPEEWINMILAEQEGDSVSGRIPVARRAPIGGFGGWIVVLVGEVGARFWYGAPNREQQLLPSADMIRRVLRQEKPVPHPLLPPNRPGPLRGVLDSIDAFIPFHQLRTVDASLLIRRHCLAMESEFQSKQAKLSVDPAAEALITLHASFKQTITGQAVASAFRRCIDSPVRRLLADGADGPIQVQCVDAGFNRLVPRATPTILVVDDEHPEVVAKLKDVSGGKCRIEGFYDIDAAIEAAQVEKPDLLLLDMWFGNQSLWREYLANWRIAYPEVPAAIFSSRRPKRAEREEIERLGGVVGFVSKDDGDLGHNLAPFLEHARWDAIVREFQSTYGYGGDQVVFDTHTQTSAVGGGMVRFDDVASTATESHAASTEDVILPPETQRSIDEFMELFLNAKLRQQLKIKRPRGLLLYGPPGNGKTMIARNLASKMRCNFLAATVGDIRGRYAGETMVHLQELFATAATRQPCVVFIDEMDGLFPPRGSDTGGGVIRDENATVSAFLTMLDGFNSDSEVFVIGATNRRDSLDEAVLRPGRLDRHIRIEKPLLSQRRQIIQQWCRRNSLARFDVEQAAKMTQGMSGADVVRVADDSALIAFRRHADQGGGHNAALTITDDDFREAVDVLRLGPKRQENQSIPISEEARRRIAFHEAGHLVTEYVLVGRVPERLTIVSRGQVGGFVVRGSSDDGMSSATFLPTRVEMIQELAILLAGGAAERLMLREHSIGVSDDRRRARDLIRLMVNEWGMGTIDAEAEFLVHGQAAERPSGRAGAEGKAAAAKILAEAEDLAAKTLEENREMLEMVAREALAHEELGPDQLKALLQNRGSV